MLPMSLFADRPLSAVLFDLDGTLLDTLPDIAEALNRALVEDGLPPLPLATVLAGVGRGAAVLVDKLTAGQAVDATARSRILDRFFHHYEALHHAHSARVQAFPGARECLDVLRARGYRLAVVTNKRRDLALRSLADGGVLDAFEIVVGGDTCAERKPHPAPLLYALECLQLPVTAALMVGDSSNDVDAARAAGMPVVVVPYGYNGGEDPRRLPADAHVSGLAELPGLLAAMAVADSA
jgi:phosphoglycolate phosphatase